MATTTTKTNEIVEEGEGNDSNGIDGNGSKSGSNGGLSARGWANVEEIMPKIAAAVQERVQAENPAIDLATAENWLLRPELADICRSAIAERLGPRDFSYPRAFAGFPEVLAAFARLFNDHFNPNVPVQESHLTTAPGAASCLDTILYNICDPGDGVLVPSPYWKSIVLVDYLTYVGVTLTILTKGGFDFQFKARSSAIPIPVPTPTINETMTLALIPALEKAYKSSTIRIKGLLLTNPQNPIGLCYPREVIEECIKFCHKNQIHYISDEVYALTSFPNPQISEPKPFISAMSIDLKKLQVDPSRVHAFWSTSKDLGQSGFRMGCSISQFNKEMQVGLALASNTQTSSLSSIFVTALLEPPRLSKLLSLNSKRLATNYVLLTKVLEENAIPYIPCDAGIYLFARLVNNKAREEITWEDESNAVANVKAHGVLVSGGKGYHGPESDRGWARIGFGVDFDTMETACDRLRKAFVSSLRK